MRRTYRSKKESANALDHKDVIQNLDEKASVFDAFYIQKIKQTKRELSTIHHGSTRPYTASSNKVRKRKYVKRIVKDVEPSSNSLRESFTQSAFLTPDKSIRVNKGQDLFDQLLNSSSQRQTASPVNSRQHFNKVPSEVRGKTYNRKKLSKVKKFNCSSSNSYDSDKENSDDSSHDVTDIRTHELVIEKQKRISPKHLDESINNIVKNISIMNHIRRSRGSSISLDKSGLKFQDHRLTSNFTSLNLSKSPLCSTPFKEKYRSQSIYKFSPIGVDKNEASPNYVTVVEESHNDDSVVLLDEKKKSLGTKEDVTPPSPIIHLSVDKSNKSDKSSKTATKLDIESPSPKKEAIVTNPKDSTDDKNNELFSVEMSDFQTSEVNPFKGFSKVLVLDNSAVNLAEQSLLHTRCNESEKVILSAFTENYENQLCSPKKIDTSSLPGDEINNDTVISTGSENSEDYDTCDSDQSSQDVVLNDLRVPVVNIERLDNSLFMKYYVKQLNDYDEKEGESSNMESDDYASFDDVESLQNSNVSSKDDDKALFEESFVNANNSCQKHLEENDISHDISKDSDEMDLVNVEAEDINTIDSNEDSISSNYIDSTRNEEEEICFSFVTTRKRNEVTNNSIILGFDNSLNSRSSTDCDKTVLSNNEIKLNADISPRLAVENVAEITNKEMNVEYQNIDETRFKKDSLKSMDTYYDNLKECTNASNKQTDNNATSCSRISKLDSSGPDVKPIVLQPGKKWERSLSIYRRMTMMTDRFDYSILEEEQLQNKGRNYRQSVISTMELQDFGGSVHNDSIISRRSTFVSKPNRSTIRIVKEPNSSRLSLCTSNVSQDLKGFLSEDCDDTLVELSKLSIADSVHEVTVLENFHDTTNRVTTARDYVLRRCNQTDAIHFDECYPETVLKNCRKIGEGVYGEVFLWRARDGRARVMKIVPIAGSTKVNGEHQKDFHEIISEIVIAMELSALRTPIDEIQRDFDEGKTVDALDLHSVENATDVFNEVLAVKCVYGTYPSRLLDLWELYDECNGSENDNPAILPVDQQYIVLELANAGQDLESFEFNNAEQAHALFLQVAFGLAVAEEAYQFEHRDLHWGNVLIAPTDQKFAVFVLRGRAHLVARCGVAGTIIDYSLSRLSVPLGSERAALYNDLANDDGLFDAVGDRQFEVYRLMRDKLGNDWKNFEPYTNILWLHYTVDKMITALRYKRTNTKIHKHYIAKLKGIKNRILEYGSAVQFVLTDNEF